MADAYEKARLKAIERKRALLENLGIAEQKFSLENTVADVKKRRKIAKAATKAAVTPQ